MKKASLRLHLVAWCFCVALCALLGAGRASGQITVHSFNQTAGGTYDWNSNTIWYQTPFTDFPNGIGAIATLNTDIAANVTVQLRDGQDIILGGLTIGDLSGSSVFTVNSLGSEKLIFDTASGSAAVLAKTISGAAEVVNSGISLVSDLDAVITTGAVTLSGVVEGAGGINKWGGGIMTLSGANTYTGPTNINSTGGSTLRLNSATGLAINGTEVRIGNATSDGRGQARLELQKDQQINDAAVLRFEAASSNNSYFKLLGFNETVGGILDTTGQGVIENVEGEAVLSSSVLTVNTVNTTDDFYFNGFFRNRASGTTLQTIGLVKDGPGALTLTGGNIRYSGSTIVNDGTLTLSGTTTLPSVITLNGDSRLVLDNSGDFRFLNTINLGGGSTATIEKTGGGNLILGHGQRVGTTANGSTSVTGILPADLAVGMPISGTNIPAGTTITAIDEPNQTITISNAATGTATNTFTFSTEIVRNATVVAGNATVTGIDTTGLAAGMAFTGSGIPRGTTILSVGSGSVTLSNAATSGSTGSFTSHHLNSMVFGRPFTSYGGTLTVAANTTFGAGFATDGSNLVVNTGKTMTVNGNLNFQEGLTLTQNGTLQVNGNMLMSGAGGLGNPPNANYTGDGQTTVTGTLTVNNISRNPNTNPNVNLSVPFSVGGAVTFNAGITRLIDSGALTGAYPSVTLKGGGTLTLEGTGAANRIGDSVPFNSGGGFLTFRHGNSSSETLGALNLQGGRLQVAVNSINSGDTATLTFASMGRVAASGATINFAATDAGSPVNTNLGGVNKVVFSTAPTLDDGIIGGWATHGINWAKYTANGVEPFVTGDYATVDTGSWTTATAFPNPNATQNIRVNAFAPTALAANRAINSLNIQDGTSRTLNLNTNVLSIESGGILVSGQNHTISGGGASRLTVGVAKNSTAELFMNVESGRNLTVSTIVGDWTDIFSTARTNGNNVLTGIGTTAGMRVGMEVTGTGIPANTTITEVISATSVRISNNATNGTTGNLTYTGGKVMLVKAGPGTVTLSNTSNTFSGGIAINEGVVAINADTSLGVAPVTFQPGNVLLNGGTLRAVGALTFDVNRGLTVGDGGGTIDVATSGQAMTVPSTIAGNGVLTKIGTGTLNLTGNNSSFLAIINDGAGDTNSNPDPLSGDDDGTLNITGSNVTIGSIDHNNGITNMGGTNINVTGNIRTDVSGSLATTQLNFTGGVTLQGELLVNGIDLVSFSGSNTIKNNITVGAGKASIGGNNDFLGSTLTINGGTLEIASAGALNAPNLPIVNVAAGNFELQGVSYTIGDLRGAGQVRNSSSANPATLVVDTRFNSTFSGNITDGSGSAMGLTKMGPGVLSLSNSVSDYSGPTRIEAGILDASSISFGFGPSSIGASDSLASNLVILSGGALRFTGAFAALTDRSLTIGVGSSGGAIIANGQTRTATIDFGIAGFSDPVAIEGTNDSGENAILVLGGFGVGENTMNLQLSDAAGQANLGVRKTGSGTWILTNPASSYSDETVILEGILGVSANNALGSATSGTYAYGGTVELRQVNYSAAETLYLLGGGMAATGGASTWGGDVVANSSSSIRVSTGSTLTINGRMMGHGPITQAGEGTLILRGNNSHANDTSSAATSGNFTVSAGRLILDYSAQNNSKLGDRGRLTLGGGRLGGILEMQGGSHEEIVLGVTIGAGSNEINRTSGTSILYTNNLTRSAGGTVDFSASRIAKTDTPNTVAGAAGILGGWATIAGTDWATNEIKTITLPVPNDGWIEAYTGYVNDVWAAGNQTTVTTSAPQTGATTNTLRFNNPVDATITLNGANTINAAAILMTPNVGTHNSTIEGPGTLRAAGAATDLIVSQYDQNGLLHISAPISNTSTGAAQGLIKNGPGALLLTGTSSFTGVVALNEGTLCIKTIADGGVASPLGASTNAAANIVFNGGVLQYAGADASTNRGFTVNFDALLDVTNENTTLTMSGGVAGTDSITKLGAGTLQLTGNATGITNYNIDQGRVQVVMNTGDNRFASSLAGLTVAGGAFEVISDPGANRTQEFQNGLRINSGASELKVSSSGLGRITALNLGNVADPYDPNLLRQGGGTVLFVENPTAGGTADIRLHVIGAINGTILPWAVYQDTSEVNQPGVNNFALANGVNNDIISADLAAVHDIGPVYLDPSNWADLDDPSEGSVSAGAFNGATGASLIEVNTLRYFNTVPGTVTVTDELDIRSGAILVGNLVGNTAKTITGGTITSNLRNSEGSRDLIIHNYNTRNTFTIGSAIVNRTFPSLVAVNFVQTGTGTTALSGNNSYTGSTFVHGGVLRLDSANAIPGGIGTSGGTSHIIVEGGVIGLNQGNFSRDVGLGSEDIEFRGSGGFAAYTVDRSVNIGGASGGLAWGSGQFLPEGGTLILGARDANATVDFQNPVALGVKDRVVRVQNGADAVDGVMSGALSGTAGLVKTDTGALSLSGSSTFAGGVSLVNGTLIAANNNALGTGALSMGTTSETQTDDALEFVVEAASLANGITIGNSNSAGQTTLSVNSTGSTLSGAVSLGRDVFVAVDAGVATTLGGNITGAGGMTLIDGGTVRLNGVNSYGTTGGAPGSQIDGGTVIRAGTISLGSSSALGTTTVELGDAAPIPLSAVDRATAGVSITLNEGVFDPLSNGFISFSGPGAFIFDDTSIVVDGFTYGAGDVGKRILIKDEDLNPERNGIYQFVLDPDGPAGGPGTPTMALVRVADLDSTAEAAYSTRVAVTNGSSAGSSFFIASNNASLNSSPLFWKQDVINPNVGLLMATSGVIASNPVDLNATNGTGTTTMGGAATFTSGTSSFTGPVTLRNIQPGTPEIEILQIVSSATGSEGAVFGGVISEENGGAGNDVLSLVKSGLGVATLSAANAYTGTTTVNQGTLLVNNLTGSGTSAGLVTVNGGAALGGIGTIGGNTTVNGTAGNRAVLSPGTPGSGGGMGTLTFNQGLLLGVHSEMLFTVGEAVSGPYNVSDRVVAISLTIDSSTLIKVFLDSLFTPDNQLSYTYNLFDWTTLTSDGDLVDQLQLPSLPSGSIWDTSLLNSQGIISIAPEPGRMVLLSMALMLGLLRRHRR